MFETSAGASKLAVCVVSTSQSSPYLPVEHTRLSATTYLLNVDDLLPVSEGAEGSRTTNPRRLGTAVELLGVRSAVHNIPDAHPPQ